MVQGSFLLFRVRGIGVFLHWSWLVVAFFEVGYRDRHYSSLFWNAAEYLTLFGIVLLHELGHALACRQVGGTATRIVLWPLGGLALVAPPPRPWPWLWCIAAGPLVNVAIVGVSLPQVLFARRLGLAEYPDLDHFLFAVAFLNLVVLAFNLLPAYPLDGGQILYALLWSLLGRGRALLTASVVGLAAAAGLAYLAWHLQAGLLAVVAAFVGFGAWRGVRQARVLLYPPPGAELLERGGAALAVNDYASASADYTAALELLSDPLARMRAVAGRGCARTGLTEFEKAAADFDDALCIAQHPIVYVARAELRRVRGDAAGAHADLAFALRLDPDFILAYVVRGDVHLQQGEAGRAVIDYSEAIHRDPGRPGNHCKRGMAHDRGGDYYRAAADFEEAVRLGPRDPEACHRLAWLLATCPLSEVRDGERAVKFARRTFEMSGCKDPNALGTLGAALAEVGLFAEAARCQEKALESAQYVAEFGESGQRRLALYREGKAFRDELSPAQSAV
jgi:tetratricopeptide (TPR) repeat protein